MSEAPKKQSIDEMLTLAKKDLATSLGVEITDAKVVKAGDTLSAALKEVMTGSAEKIGIEQEIVNQSLTKTHAELAKGVNVDSLKQKLKASALISVAEKQGEQTIEAITKATTVDTAFGGKADAYTKAFTEASETAGLEQIIKTMPAGLDNAIAMADKVEADRVEGERLIKSVTQPKIDAMKAESATFVDGAELKSAVELRAEHVKQHLAAQAITKDGTKLSEDVEKALKAANEAAAKAEKEATGLWGKLRGAHAAGDAQKAFDRTMQTAIDNSRETNPTLHAALKANLESGVKTELGELGTMLTKDRFANAGLQTELSKDLGAAVNAAGGAGKWLGSRGAMAAGGVVLAGLAVKAAMSDKPVDPNTNEKPKMSFMGKVTTALAAVVGAGMIVAAVRGGNPVQGLKEGEGVVGKFTSMLHATAKTGAYAGR